MADTKNGAPDEPDKRVRRLSRAKGLRNERATWIPRYREISEFLLPFSGRYFSQDRNRGAKSFNSIYDSTGTRAARILAAGLMAGVTSPARPWFRLATPDPKLDASSAVKQWLADTAQMMRDIFAKSNTYRALHTGYEELGAFGTAAILVDDNFDTVIWQTPLTAGEYSIGANDLGKVDTVAREFEMTVAQLVAKFGYKNCSKAVQALWDNKRSYDTWIPVVHLIEPRGMDERNYDSPLATDMPFASSYFELGANENKFLRESGYREFPALCPRWNTRGGDIYGNGPGFEALCDIKQLQHEQLRKAQGIDYMTRPPLQMPTALKGLEANTLPGGVVYYDATGSSNAIQTLFDVKLDLEHLRADINDVQARIDKAFYADLFLMLSGDDPTASRQPITATEVVELKEEKLLMLGPVLERLHDELLSPLIDLTFARMVQTGIVPEPPQEMRGVELSVQFISVLAQAQKAVGLQSFDRILGYVANIAQFKPEVIDKLDTDELIDQASDMLGVDPKIVVADDKVAYVRAARAKQQQAAAMAQAAPQGAQAVAQLGGVDTTKPNLATDTMKALTGY